MDQNESRKYICLKHDTLRKTLLRLTLNACNKEHALNITYFKEIANILRGDKAENSKAMIISLYHLCSDRTFSIKLIKHKEIVSRLEKFHYHTREVRRLFWRIGSEHGLAFKFNKLLSEKLPVQFKINKEPLGKGGFGEVCLVIDKNKTAEKEFVAKVINCMEKTDKDNCKREITILMNIHHKRIITFYGFTESPQSITIYLGYMKMGNLSDFIQSQTRLIEETTLLFTRQILEGVAYIHNKNIIHRDIKGSNILLKTKDSLKLGDFGLSKLSGNNTTSKSADIGTIRFMAPEVIHYEEDIKCKYNNKVDIWSVGCTVVEMITGKPPNSNCEAHQIVLKFYGRQKPDYILPEGTSPALSEFINKTLEFDPENRPGAQELLNTDQFLTGQTSDIQDSKSRFCNEDLVLKLRQNGIERKCDNFVSLKRFAIENLPQNYQNKTSLLKLIEQIGSLTVLLTFTPDDPNGKTCTGMLCFDDVETYTDDLNKQCTCSDCRGHNRLVLQWAKVEVVTSARMMSEINIKSLQVRVGFADDENKDLIIRGLEVLDCDLDADRCTVICSWHDLNLLEDYLDVWQNYIRFSSYVRETYRRSKEKHQLAVVVSHPFGCSKHVSFGEWKEQFKLRTIPFTRSHYTKYSYTTPVLTGCEGAPVLIPGSGMDSCIHLHSYTEKGLNYSGTGVN